MDSESGQYLTLQNTLEQMTPQLLITDVEALYLRLYANASQAVVNKLLNLEKLRSTIGKDQSSANTDVRSIFKRWQLNPKLVAYAACPKCDFLYASESTPWNCSNELNGKKCGADVAKSGLTKGSNPESAPVPIKPFLVQSYEDFIARLVSRPGMEDLLRNGANCVPPSDGYLSDIKHGQYLRGLKAPDNSPFMTADTKELRIAMACSVDWFNPHTNKASGKSVSVGCVSFTILNLPPNMRKKAENIYLAALIPGPKEPSKENINSYLEKIVDIFCTSWEKGHAFTRGRNSTLIVRSILAILISDLPAARKISGAASFSAHVFCSMCNLQKSNINNINYREWPKRTKEQHMEDANAWKKAETQKARNTLYKNSGIRWSELLRLPQWDPLQSVVVDAMHNTLLGMAAYHARFVLGIQELKTAEDKSIIVVDAEELERGLDILSSHPKAAQLRKMKSALLKELCYENDVVPLPKNGKKVLKADLIEALLKVSYFKY